MSLDISAIAFDIDGTLYPAYRFNLRILPFMLKNYKFMLALYKTRNKVRQLQIENPEAKLEDFFKFQAEEISHYINAKAEDVEKFLNEEIYSGWKKYFVKIKPYPYAKKTIEEFKNRGIKIAVLSDFLPEQKNDVWGILPLCNTYLSSEEAGVLKPSIFVFKKLSEKLDVPCDKILYVGNNLKYDIAGANNAGMYSACIKSKLFILLNKIFHFDKKNKLCKPDIYFSNYKQLLKIVLNP